MTFSRRDFLKSSTATIATAASPLSMPPASAAPRTVDEFIDYDALGMAALIKTR